MKKIQTKTELEMVELYKSGHSMKKIAEIFAVSTGTVFHYLKQHIPIDERRRRQFRGKILLEEFDVEQIKEAYKKGASSVTLAKRLGVHPQTIITHLKRAGVDTSKDKKFASKVDKKLLDSIIETYKLTGSILQTAKRFKLHPSSIHYRLTKLGIVKKKHIDQKMAKKKYEMLTRILVKLFEKMGYKIRFVQKRHIGHGPDMVLEKDGKTVIVEHKATVKKSWYWKQAIEEAETQMEKFHTDTSFVVSTSSRPRKMIKGDRKITMIFYEDLIELLKQFDFEDLIKDVDYIASTPSV